ncbi:oxidoreductase alpha (molybdopterin) subunit [Enterobacter cloacae]|uniref:Oxidoreductase alpha (Molybdopterin) subunit n=2 Tax=Enterobacter cloacae TaxID=550 RepID=A0A377M0Z9_ENTCL|nr:oxidoreductase alpha (molybdopterin) subunit [Enterobacter cloacae]
MATYSSTDIASTYFQVKAGGDAAALKGIAKHLLQMEAGRGNVLDHAFIAEHTQGFEDFAADIAQTSWDAIERESG